MLYDSYSTASSFDPPMHAKYKNDCCSAIDSADFDGAVRTVTFRADEGTFVADIPVDVMITDDDIDESQDEYFIVYFRVDAATDTNSISISRSATTGVILDDDGK